MVNLHHPNTSVITVEANQLITIIIKVKDSLIIEWFSKLQLGCIKQLVSQLGKKIGDNF